MLVVDASAALAWIFRDEASEAADRLFDRVAAEGAFVPAIFHLEVANVLLQAERRGRINASYALERLGIIAELPLTTDAETSRQACRDTLAMARTERPTAYDGAYLELAIRLGATFATLDTELSQAARRRGVPVFD